MMHYLSGVRHPSMIDYLNSRVIGLLTTPATNYDVRPYWMWAADNGCFSAATYKGDKAWFNWLQGVADTPNCLFAVAPDVLHTITNPDGSKMVIGDAAATITKSAPWLQRIRNLGLPAAFVAQDGLQDLKVPWDEFDVLFIGGSDAWKLGPHPIALSLEARSLGKSVHVGRVNSLKRFRHCAEAVGADTVDGTYLRFGMSKNLPRLLGWIRQEQARYHPQLAAA